MNKLTLVGAGIVFGMVTTGLIGLTFLNSTVEQETQRIESPKRVNYHQEELICLAKNIYFEARGQDRVGMLMVGHVTLNRVKSERFPKTICEVVYQPNQFSWTNDKTLKIDENDKYWGRSIRVANDVLNRTWDRANGALFYYNPYKIKPTWSADLVAQSRHKDHVFLTD